MTLVTGPLEELRDVAVRLDGENIPYFLVGSLGSMYYGRPRFTKDVDLVVQLRPSVVQKFTQIFPIEDYIAAPENIILKKLDYYRDGAAEKHLTDIREILAGSQVDDEYLQLWIEKLGLKAEWGKI
ncbi:MAG: hypothetical protein HC902_03585 [Calothrix sp. SM1_5_4]|nr:hypothetical protein [Calothrix sp. SM1_5_4]